MVQEVGLAIDYQAAAAGQPVNVKLGQDLSPVRVQRGTATTTATISVGAVSNDGFPSAPSAL
jgi:hypothetical protein